MQGQITLMGQSPWGELYKGEGLMGIEPPVSMWSDLASPGHMPLGKSSSLVSDLQSQQSSQCVCFAHAEVLHVVGIAAARLK